MARRKKVVSLSRLRRRSKRNTLKLVSKSFEETSEISTQEVIVPLICPITKKRLELPCIGLDCKHLSCFDGKSFLDVNEERFDWCCPFCNCYIEYDGLRLDSLIKEILSKTSSDCSKVSFDRKGNWKPCSEENGKKCYEEVFVPDEDTIVLDDLDDYNDTVDETEEMPNDGIVFLQEVSWATETPDQMYAEIITLDDDPNEQEPISSEDSSSDELSSEDPSSEDPSSEDTSSTPSSPVVSPTSIALPSLVAPPTSVVPPMPVAPLSAATLSVASSPVASPFEDPPSEDLPLQDSPSEYSPSEYPSSDTSPEESSPEEPSLEDTLVESILTEATLSSSDISPMHTSSENSSSDDCPLEEPPSC